MDAYFMLQALVSGQTAARVLLFLHHRGERSEADVSRGLGLTHQQIRHQLNKFTGAGVLLRTEKDGRPRYRFDSRPHVNRRLRDLLQEVLDRMTDDEKRRLVGFGRER